MMTKGKTLCGVVLNRIYQNRDRLTGISWKALYIKELGLLL